MSVKRPWMDGMEPYGAVQGSEGWLLPGAGSVGGYGRQAEWAGSSRRASVGELWRMLGWSETREDVVRESQGRVAVVGVSGIGKRALLAALRGWEATTTPAEGLPAVEDQGFWRVVDLPEEAQSGGEWSEAWEQTRAADLVVLVTVHDELNGEALRWAARVRATGQPMVTVLVGETATEFGRAVLAQRVGPQVVLLPEGNREEIESLLKSMMGVSPDLVVPLGRELPGWRRWLAERLIAQTVLTCGLWGLEPISLMDLPMQIAAQTGLALRLLAMYGYGTSSPGRREALLLVGSGLLLRLLLVQLLKVLPVAGWLLAGLVSAGGTWLLGWLLLMSLEQEDDGEPWSLLRRAQRALHRASDDSPPSTKEDIAFSRVVDGQMPLPLEDDIPFWWDEDPLAPWEDAPNVPQGEAGEPEREVPDE